MKEARQIYKVLSFSGSFSGITSKTTSSCSCIKFYIDGMLASGFTYKTSQLKKRRSNEMKTTVWGVKQLLVITMLLFSVTALAVDTDGDGVDDSVDAFPTNGCATIDTDGDGQPDSLHTGGDCFFEGFESGNFSQNPWTSSPACGGR